MEALDDFSHPHEVAAPADQRRRKNTAHRQAIILRNSDNNKNITSPILGSRRLVGSAPTISRIPSQEDRKMQTPIMGKRK